MTNMYVSAKAQQLSQALSMGERRVLAKCCSLAESTRKEDQILLAEVLACVAVPTQPTRRIAVTGAPGVGKSSIIENWGASMLRDGHKVAVLAIDPSSKRTGGSILGDKTRMQSLANAPDAFVRPQPSGNHLGGTARATRLCIPLCEAAGFDTILVETVGVGQSEVEVADMVDACLLLTLPTAGDDVQAIKRGIMEVADVVAVTKSDIDRAAAQRAAAILQGAIRLLQPPSESWTSRIVLANAVNDHGLEELALAVDAFFAADRLDVVQRRREHQRLLWFESDVSTIMHDAMMRHERIHGKVIEMRQALHAGRIPVPLATLAVMEVVHDILQWKDKT
jgi:LAO/AO transport system kinase